MSDNETEAKQEQSCKNIRRFIVIKPAAIAEAPFPTGSVRALPPDSRGVVVYETDDIVWFESHVKKGDFREESECGRADGEMYIHVEKGAVEGDDTIFKVFVWNGGILYSVLVLDKDMLSLPKVRAKVFGVSGYMIPKMSKDEWNDYCNNMYKKAVQQNAITIAEMDDLPSYLEFVNYIENARPVLNEKELELEGRDVILYDVGTQEIRALRKHFEEMITITPGMTYAKFKKILKKLIKRNADQVHLGADNRKYAIWILKPEMFPKLMSRVKALMDGKEGKK